jgi:hypothetical protein
MTQRKALHLWKRYIHIPSLSGLGWERERERERERGRGIGDG